MRGYEQLGQRGREIFEQTYSKHFKTLGSSERLKRSRGKIKSVKANNKEQCIEVKFTDGEWFKYFKDGTWG